MANLIEKANYDNYSFRLERIILTKKSIKYFLKKSNKQDLTKASIKATEIKKTQTKQGQQNSDGIVDLPLFHCSLYCDLEMLGLELFSLRDEKKRP